MEQSEKFVENEMFKIEHIFKYEVTDDDGR
jgi:hypothetical protein